MVIIYYMIILPLLVTYMYVISVVFIYMGYFYLTHIVYFRNKIILILILVASGGCEPVRFISLVRHYAATPHMSTNIIAKLETVC